MSAEEPVWHLSAAFTDQQLGSVLEDIEEGLKTGDIELDQLLLKMQQLLRFLTQGRLTPDQASHIVRVSMAKYIMMLLKMRLSEASTERVNAFFQTVMHATAVMLRSHDACDMVDLVARVFSDSPNHYFYRSGVMAHSPSCDVDSQSSGDASCSDASDGEGTTSIIASLSPHDDVSPYLVRNVEYFYHVGGFTAILDRLGAQPTLSLNAMRTLLRPLVKVKDLLKRNACHSFAKRVQQAIQTYVANLTDEQLKQEDRKTMTDVYRMIDALLMSAKLQTAAQTMDHFRLALALKCLRTPFLEKRLIGITDIKEMISASLRKQEYMDGIDREHAGAASGAPPPLSCWCTPEYLVDWLEREQVVELIFGEGLHDQVVRRCVDVLVFLAMRSAMDSRLLTLVWKATLDKHETVKQCIYQVLVELASHLQLPLLVELYEHIHAIPLAEYTSHTLVLLRGFALSAISSPHNQQKPKHWFCLRELWDIMQDGSPVSGELRLLAGSVLQELLGWQHCAPQRGQFLVSCVQSLRAGTSVPQALRLMVKTASSFPCKARKKNDTISSVLEWLAGSQNLLLYFFEDFRRYHQETTSQRLQPLQEVLKSSREAGSKEREVLASTALRAAVATHIAQLQERLDFLNFCIINAPLSLSVAQLDVLWDCCVVSPCCTAEEDMLFRWLEQARMHSSNALDMEATRHLFGRFGSTELQTTTPTGYSMIEYLFRWINWKEQRFIQQDTTNFLVLDLPLFGEEMLWSVALRARDADVGRRCVGFLTQLYHSLVPEQGAQPQQQRRREFVDACMTHLAASSERLRELSPPSTRAESAGGALDAATERTRDTLSLCVERCLTLLRLFVEEVEAKLSGVAEPTRRHGTVVRGTPMRVLVTVVGGSNTPKLEVNIDSNQTVGQLRLKIWQQLAGHGEWQPEQSRMLRMITAGRELKEERRMLAELKLREPYTIHVMKSIRRALAGNTRILSCAQSVACLKDDGFRPPRTFSNPGEAGSSLNKPTQPEDGTPAGSAGTGATDMDLDGSTPGGSGNGDAVASNAAAAASGSTSAAEDVGSLPGQLLSEEGTNFGTLFELLTLRDERLSERAWQLLMMLPTNRAMESGLASLQALEPPQQPDWPALLHAGPSSFKLLYSLQIVDFFMLQGENADGGASSDGSGGNACRSPWCNAFVAHGGLQHLLSMLRLPSAGSPEKDLLDPTRGSQRKLCLVLLLRVLCQFLLREPRVGALQLVCSPLEPLDLAASAPAAAHTLQAPQPQPMAVPAAGAPSWAQRNFSMLVSDSLADEARGHQFTIQLLALLERVAAEAAPPDNDLLDQTPTEGSEEALDVQIVREVLQLLVACALSECAALASIFRGRPLHNWLLACDSTAVRLEIAAALYSLCCHEPVLALPPTAGAFGPAAASVAVSALTLAMLRELLPIVEESGGRCRQYFELYEALLARECAADKAGAFPAQEMCCQLATLVREHPMRERRDRPELVDQALLGYMNLLLAMVRARPSLKAHLGHPDGVGLMATLFENLFFLPSLIDVRRLGPAAPPKCKSPECRSAALGLLLEMADGDSDNLSLLTALMLNHQLERGGGPRAQWHFMPAAQEKARCGYVGLKNLGATCYLNSLVQQLFMIPAFRNAILALPLPPAASPAPDTGAGSAAHAGEEQTRSLLNHVQLMFGYLQESEKKWFDTRELCGVIRDAENAPINPSIQMDVDEFFMQLFDQLESALKGTPQADLLKTLFQGQMVNQLVAKDTKHKYSERLEAWFTISLDCKSKKSVLDALSHFFEGEVLDGDNKYKCDDGEYVEAIKRCCVQTLPPVLILHLKRFEFDFDLMKKFKINDHCEFPATIDMQPYTKGYVEQQERTGQEAVEGEGNDVLRLETDGDTEAPSGCMYALVGVLVHSGTSDSGHYYSFIKERRGAASSGMGGWLHFNDTLVEPFDPRDIPKCCYGGVETVTQWDVELHKHVQRNQPKPHSAYMLFYERIEPTRPTNGEAAPAGAPAAVAPLADGEDGEPMQLQHVPSSSLVPAHIVRAVWAENMQFLRDRYVFDAIHFHAIRRLVALALPTAAIPDQAAADLPMADQQLGLRAMQLGCRFFVDTLAHAKDKGSLPEWVALLQAGLQSSLPACRWLLLTAEQDDWLRQILLVCTVADVRTGFADLLLCAMRCLRPSELQFFAEAQAAALAATADNMEDELLEGEEAEMEDELLDASGRPTPPRPKAASLRVVQALLTMLNEAPSHWRHFPQFFLVLLEFAHLGAEERAWLLRRCVVTQLVDFYLGDESPLAAGDGPYHRPKRTRMGDKFALPNLEHMLALISLLARSATRSLEQSERTPLSLESPLLTMERQEHQLAVCGPFLAKVLKEGLNVHALSELVQHYCYASQQTSSQILSVVLHGIDTMDSESLGPYLHLFTAIIGMDDPLIQWRTAFAMPRLLRVIAANMRYKQATIACLRMLVAVCAQTLPRRWMLQHQTPWLQEWLIGGHTDAVRVAAEELTCSILAAELPQLGEAEAAAGHEPPCPAAITATFDHLLALLVVATEISRDSGPDPPVGGGRGALEDQPSPRLAPYFRVCSWCVRRGAMAHQLLPQGGEPDTRLNELFTAYAVQDSHHWECDETKLEMIRFWFDTAHAPQPDGPHGPLALAADPQNFRKLLDTFVSLRPNERFLMYNREFLPPFYGLLRAALNSPGGPACALVLQTHRNWEWAIRYVLVESPDYAQLPADGEPEGNLGPSLMCLLRSSCASAEFRLKVLNTTLSCKKLPHNATNVLTLLELTIVDDEGLDLAIELGALQQLCSCLDGTQGLAYIESQRLRSLHDLLHLIGRLAQRIRMQAKDDEARRQRLLQAWDATGGCQSLLNVVFVLLRASLRLRLDAASRAPLVRSDNVLRAVPPVQLRPLQEVCFDLATALAALDRSWASLIVGSLLTHHVPGPELQPPAGSAGAAACDPHSGEADGSGAAEGDRPDTLAGLTMEEARRGAAANPERLCNYYEFAHGLLTGAVKAHDDPSVGSCCVRLAVVLATETSTLPRAHAVFAQLLVQVARGRPSLVAVGCAHGPGEALLRRLLAEEPALLRQCDDSRACCEVLLRHVPPSDAQLYDMLDVCAARILELRAGSTGDRGGGGAAVVPPPAKSGDDDELMGLQQAVQLMSGAAAAAAEHWAALKAKSPGLQ